MAARTKRFVVCLRNEGFEVSLERRKIYVAVPDSEAARQGLVRVLDESGEDYLFPEGWFAEIDLPRALARAIDAS